jgi:hypothetical protein
LEALQELAISARGCVASSLSEGRSTVPFVLERVLDQCAADFQGRAVQISRLHDPVPRAVEFLAGADDDPVKIAASLIRALSLQ